MIFWRRYRRKLLSNRKKRFQISILFLISFVVRKGFEGVVEVSRVEIEN
jgi:hypothetical protein